MLFSLGVKLPTVGEDKQMIKSECQAEWAISQTSVTLLQATITCSLQLKMENKCLVLVSEAVDSSAMVIITISMNHKKLMPLEESQSNNWQQDWDILWLLLKEETFIPGVFLGEPVVCMTTFLLQVSHLQLVTTAVTLTLLNWLKTSKRILLKFLQVEIYRWQLALQEKSMDGENSALFRWTQALPL